jgi:hypothetical protein
MKAVLWTTVFLGLASAEAVWAAPTIKAQNFKCEYRSRVDGNWEKRGYVYPEMQGQSLLLKFESTDEGSGMDQIGTTNTGFEYRVEARCPGSITLEDNKPFKIRDFKFGVGGAYIGSNQGLIELKVAGWTTITNTNKKDSFEKSWTIRKPDLDRNDAFVSKQESNTVCGQQLTLRFDDLRGVVVSDAASGEITDVNLQYLNLNLDPC